MELTISNILLCLFLGVIVYQDFKYRAIHIVWLCLVFGMSCVVFWLSEEPLRTLLESLTFVFAVMLVLWLYLCAKNKRFINPFKNYIGLGDVLYFVAIIPLFGLHNYMLYFISGMVLSLVSSLFFMLKKNKTKLIPLAGILAFYLVGLKTADAFLDTDLFYGFFIPTH